MSSNLSGFCASPATEDSHAMCTTQCACNCHKTSVHYSGKGILFTIIQDREQLLHPEDGGVSVLAAAIKEAKASGHTTPKQMAHYLTTSAFKHVTKRGPRYNSILQANDAVGAHILSKLYSAYTDLMQLWEEQYRMDGHLKAQAEGIALAVAIIRSPFQVEDPDDPRLVVWDEVDKRAAVLQTSWDNARRVGSILDKNSPKKKGKKK